jgi:hypothetical protein
VKPEGHDEQVIEAVKKLVEETIQS